MTDTINPECAYGSPNALWSTCFSRVSGCPEAEGTGSLVHQGERLRRAKMFRTSDADPDDAKLVTDFVNRAEGEMPSFRSVVSDEVGDQRHVDAGYFAQTLSDGLRDSL